MIETPAQILEREASQDAVQSFIAWRKLIRKPLTERAAALIAKSLREITGQGGDADDALDLAQEHGWQTIKPDWYWRQRPQPRQVLTVINGGTHGPCNSQQIPNRPQNRPDPAIEQIARLAGIGKAPGNGGR